MILLPFFYGEKILIKSTLITIPIVAMTPFILLIFFSKRVSDIEFNRRFEKKLIPDFVKKLEFSPSKIKYLNSGIYAYNFEGGQILKLDEKGNVTIVFGELGENPGQFQVVADYYTDNEKLYAIDLRNKSISIFNLQSSELVDFFKINKNFNNASLLSIFSYVISSFDSLNSNPKFEIYNFSGELVKVNFPYGTSQDGSFTTDGIFVNNGKVNLHFCYHISDFHAFDSYGKLLYRSKTIENYFEQPLVITEGRGKYISPVTKTITIGASADEKFIYVLSLEIAVNEKKEDFQNNSPLDIYALSSGEYIKSVYIPNYEGKKVRSISCAENGFYAIQGNNLIHYEP